MNSITAHCVKMNRISKEYNFCDKCEEVELVYNSKDDKWICILCDLQ